MTSYIVLLLLQSLTKSLFIPTDVVEKHHASTNQEANVAALHAAMAPGMIQGMVPGQMPDGSMVMYPGAVPYAMPVSVPGGQAWTVVYGPPPGQTQWAGGMPVMATAPNTSTAGQSLQAASRMPMAVAGQMPMVMMCGPGGMPVQTYPSAEGGQAAAPVAFVAQPTYPGAVIAGGMPAGQPALAIGPGGTWVQLPAGAQPPVAVAQPSQPSQDDAKKERHRHDSPTKHDLGKPLQTQPRRTSGDSGAVVVKHPIEASRHPQALGDTHTVTTVEEGTAVSLKFVHASTCQCYGIPSNQTITAARRSCWVASCLVFWRSFFERNEERRSFFFSHKFGQAK